MVRGSGIEAGETQRLVGAPVLAAMPDQRGIDESIDLGQGPVKSRRGVLARTAQSVLGSLCAESAARPAA